MPGWIPTTAVALALLGFPPRATATVDIYMLVEGPHGPFAGGAAGAPNDFKLLSAQLDFGAAGAGAQPAKPVIVTRPTDELSWQFLRSVASAEALRVVISTTQVDQTSSVPHRRVVTLSGARIMWIHSALNARPGDGSGLGLETIAFTYERMDVEDDGARVYSSGP